MRHICLLVIFATYGCAAPSTSLEKPAPVVQHAKTPELSLSKYPTLYASQDGAEVLLVPATLPNDDSEYALIMFQGKSSVLDGIPLLYTKDTNGRYRTVIDGRESATHHPSKGSNDRLTVYLPESTPGIHMKKVPKATVNTQDLYTQYRRFEADGTLADIALFDHVAFQKSEEKDLAASVEEMNLQCKTQIRASIDWSQSSATELSERRDEYNLRCTAALETLKELCEWEPRLSSVVASTIESHVCSYKSGLRLEMQGQTLHFAPALVEQSRQSTLWPPLATILQLGKIVLTNNKGDFIVSNLGDPQAPLWFGTKTALFKQRQTHTPNRNTRYIFGGASSGILTRKSPGSWTMRCGDDYVPYVEASEEQATSVLSAKHHPITWKREPYLLARDDRGVYYYVDKLRDEHGGKGFRVFFGKRGKVKERSLTDIVEDAEGMIFATKTGNLRLLVPSNTLLASWIRGGKEQRLTVLDLRTNSNLIYTGLGLYSAEALNTPCD